jgi:hypothetical protein
MPAAAPTFQVITSLFVGSVAGLAAWDIGGRTLAVYNKKNILGTAVFGQKNQASTTKVVTWGVDDARRGCFLCL